MAIWNSPICRIGLGPRHSVSLLDSSSIVIQSDLSVLWEGMVINIRVEDVVEDHKKQSYECLSDDTSDIEMVCLIGFGGFRVCELV